MLFILIVSIFAAFSFGAAARKKRYDSTRFWVYPLALGSGLYLLAFGMGFVVRKVIKHEDSVFLRAYPYTVSGLSIIMLCILISKAWKQISALPQRVEKTPSTETTCKG
jgi:Na+-transporting methylmalonyl-CoA/oxaloacetate decarboxylase gamma subunit